FVGRELAASLLVLGEIEAAHLDGLELGDPERAPLPFRLLVKVVAEIHLRPYAAGQEAVMLANVLVWDVDKLVPEVDELRPVLVVLRHVANFDLVDELVSATLAH